MIVACADKGGVTAPPLPEHVEAGSLRFCPTCARRSGYGRSAGAAWGLAGAAGADAQRDHAAQGQPLAAGRAGARARWAARRRAPRRRGGRRLDGGPHEDDGEEPLAIPAASFSALDWLDGARGMRASVPGAALRDAAAKLRSLAKSDEITDADRRTLEAAAAAAAMDAARVLSRAQTPRGDRRAGRRGRSSLAGRPGARALERMVPRGRSGAGARRDRSRSGGPRGRPGAPGGPPDRAGGALRLDRPARRRGAHGRPGRGGGRGPRRPAPRPPCSLDPCRL